MNSNVQMEKLPESLKSFISGKYTAIYFQSSRLLVFKIPLNIILGAGNLLQTNEIP